MTRLFLRLLGTVHLAGDDGATSSQTGHAATVLSLLGMECGRVVSFDRLVEQLWGDDPPASSRSTLYAVVSRIRGQLRGSELRIVAKAPGYVLEAPPGTVDALELADLVATAEEAAAAGDAQDVLRHCASARRLWRGPPFTDAVVRDVLRGDARKLTRLRDRADELTAEALLAVGRGAEAERIARGLVEHDPFNESYWRLRMRAEHESGRTAAALATYVEFRGLLADELGIEPGDVMRELHLDILRSADGGGQDGVGQVDVEAAVPGRPGTALAPVRPPVGREAERAAVESVVDATLGGRGRVVLLRGEAGIGKSRLAEHAADRARRAGARVVWARAIDGPGTPSLWVWEQVVRELGRAGGGHGDGRMPELDPGHTPDVARFRLHESIADHVLSAAEGEPVLIVLDDLQWADEGSVEVLRLLALRIADRCCGVVATARHGRRGSVDPLARLGRGDHVDVHVVGPLSHDEVAAFVALWHDGTPPDPEAVEQLRLRTGGNAFFLREVLRGRDETVPASVSDLVAARLDDLSPEAVALVECAAVAGRVVDPQLLARAAGTTVMSAVGLLEAARAAGLVANDRATASLAFVHDLAREAVVERLGAPRRIELHGRLAAAIAEVHADDLDLHMDELAAHRFEAAAGSPTLPAFEACMAAADQAAAHLAFERAALQRARALTMLPATAEHRELRFEVLFALTVEQRSSGDVVGAAGSLHRAIGLARSLGDTSLLRRALSLLGEVTLWNWRQLDEVDDETVAELQRLLAVDGTGAAAPARSDAERILLQGALAVELYYGEDADRSIGLAAEAVDAARRLGDPVVLGRVLNNLVIAAWRPGEDDRRLAAVDESLALVDHGLPQTTEVVARLHRAPLRLQRLDVEGFLEDVTRADWLAPRLGRSEIEAQAASQWTSWHLLRGDLDAAAESIERAHRLLARTSLWGADWIRLAALTALSRVRGDLDALTGVLVSKASEDAHRPLRWTAVLALAATGAQRDARVLQSRWGLGTMSQRRHWGSPFEWAQAAETALLLGLPDLEQAERRVAAIEAPVVLVGTALAAWGPTDALRARLAAARGDEDAAAGHVRRLTQVQAAMTRSLGVEPSWPLPPP